MRLKMKTNKSIYSDSWFWEILSVIFSTLCFTATITTLAFYNGKSEPNMPKGITLNAIVSILASGTKSSLIFVTSQSIGQLKWIWFRRKRKLLDLQKFDDASRGSWGSFIILLEHRACSMVSLGAIITLLAVTVDPFMQQLINYPVRQVPSKTHQASAKQVTGSSNIRGWTGIAALQAINAGIWMEKFDIDPLCDSGNCTWPIFQSLAYCTMCKDMTSNATITSCPATRPNVSSTNMPPIDCNITLKTYLPQAVQTTFEAFQDEGVNLSMTLTEDIIFRNMLAHKIRHPPLFDNLFDPMLSLSHAKIEPHNVRNLSQLEQPMLEVKALTQCAITLCLKTYDISVSNGSPSVKVLSEDYGSWNLTDIFGFTWKPRSTNFSDGDALASEFDVHSPDGFDADTDFLNGSKIGNWVFHEGNSTWEKRSTTVSSDAIAFVIEIGLDHVVENIAASMSKFVRDRSNSTALGTAFINEKHVSISWIWLLIPTTVIVLTIIFLGFSIGVTSGKTPNSAYPLWKSSILPVIYHGLGGSMETRDNTSHEEDYMSLSQMEAAAQSTRVRLENSPSSERLILR